MQRSRGRRCSKCHFAGHTLTLSLGVCCLLYCAATLALTGLVYYEDIDEAAPFAKAFDNTGLGWIQEVINIGATLGLGTTLLTGMYAQSRMYFGIARDDLFPVALGQLHEIYHTPANAQVLCGVLAGLLGAFFQVACNTMD